MQRATLLLLLAPALPAQQLAPEFLEELDNGVIRVGVDPRAGGAIAYLSRSDVDDNVINIHDLGRYVQQSYFSGPCPFVPGGATQHPGWAGWCWNPIQAGDVFGNVARTPVIRNDGTTLYTRTVPRQWALDGIDGDCFFETWLTLEDNRVHARFRLENQRPDPRRYPAVHQELPAVYTIGRLHRLFTYTGDAPFTGQPVQQIVNSGPPWAYWESTERWSALVDDSGWGLGVFHPTASLTVGGFAGVPGSGGPKDNPTGYISPLHTEVIDHDITYEYEVVLVLGDLEADIRAYAYASMPELRPDYAWHTDRAHCYPLLLSDPSPPFDGAWRLSLDQDDPQVFCPPGLWQAADVPRLELTAAFRTQASVAELFFRAPGEGFSASKRLDVPILPDGVLRTYTIDLSAHPEYIGAIAQLRFDPIASRQPGDEVDLVSLRYAP